MCESPLDLCYKFLLDLHGRTLQHQKMADSVVPPNVASRRRVAYLSMDEQDLAKYSTHHELLTIEPMKALGWDVDVSLNWHLIKTIDWSVYSAIVIRTTWDYQATPDEFLASLRYLRDTYPTIPLLNDIDIVEWNLDKHYLKEMSEKYNVPVVPTVWSSTSTTGENGRKTVREAVLEAIANFPLSTQFVIKPCISAGSDFTYHTRRSAEEEGASLQLAAKAHRSVTTASGTATDSASNAESVEWLTSEESMSHLEAVFDGPNALCHCHFMVQPFLAAIKQEGEFSVFLFHGEVSHVTQKVPKAGDFRVQEQFGGEQILRDYVTECPSELRTGVSNLLQAFPRLAGLLYGRVDLVRDAENLHLGGDNGDGKLFLVAELEVIEPSLFLSFAPGSAERFAAAFHKLMATLPIV